MQHPFIKQPVFFVMAISLVLLVGFQLSPSLQQQLGERLVLYRAIGVNCQPWDDEDDVLRNPEIGVIFNNETEKHVQVSCPITGIFSLGDFDAIRVIAAQLVYWNQSIDDELVECQVIQTGFNSPPTLTGWAFGGPQPGPESIGILAWNSEEGLFGTTRLDQGPVSWHFYCILPDKFTRLSARTSSGIWSYVVWVRYLNLEN